MKPLEGLGTARKGAAATVTKATFWVPFCVALRYAYSLKTGEPTDKIDNTIAALAGVAISAFLGSETVRWVWSLGEALLLRRLRLMS
ncbi:MAG TPA: hypothetical protein VFQ35_20490, partial [Polyangiaceae bacterium]|nr:hypothetical protein [Polyangiaceae bacterium]